MGDGISFSKFIKEYANKSGTHFKTIENQPRIRHSQFAYKRKCKRVLAFMITQAKLMLRLKRRCRRSKICRNIPTVDDEICL
mmetsp:Transcript_7432/g.8448  ORF Transcript_7432/g.8448 Transcript_7432/m.8448 type:complete len:82 (+) Transcript_7432:232-477(+)